MNLRSTLNLMVPAMLLMGSILHAQTDAPVTTASDASTPAPAGSTLPSSPEWDAIIGRAASATGTGWNADKAALDGRPHYVAYFKTFANYTPPPAPTPPEGKLNNLPDTPTKPRFALTDKVWPDKAENASICLWEDDKVAAYSFGIDDNNAPDVPFWKGLSDKMGGLKITWNLITINIGGGFDSHRVNGAGTWDLWKQVLSDGYHIASHSVSHVGDPIPTDGWPGPDWEAIESKKTLDENLPGHQTKVFVYPGSALKEFNGSYAWRPSISKYYVAARATSGIPINPANQIDYFSIRTTSHPDQSINPTDPKFADFDITNILNSDPSRRQYKYYRGWATTFIHGANGGLDWDTQPYYMSHQKVFDWVTSHRDDIWIGFFDDVALYGEERDTATLKVDEATSARIAYTLTSEMDPTVFNYPLTVKVRIPDTWKSVTATQKLKSIPVQVIQHEGASYALIKSLPDQGQVLLVPASSS